MSPLLAGIASRQPLSHLEFITRLLNLNKVCIQPGSSAGSNRQFNRFRSIAYFAGSALASVDLGGLEFAVLPLNVHLKSAARPQSSDRAVRPVGWQRGQKADFSGVALKQSFSDASRES